MPADISFCTYNIRGLNNKQSFAKDFISSRKLSLVSFLETHVQFSNAAAVSNFISPSFSWIFNYDFHSNGRIWVGYDPSIWRLSVVSSSAQHITVLISNLSSDTEFYGSFVYGFNTSAERRPLWSDLLHIHSLIDQRPWCISGDFNTCLGPSESSNSSRWNVGMLDFMEFISQSGLSDLRTMGSRYTWWDSSTHHPVFKRLDRCLVNGEWLCVFPQSQADILPRGLSDHCPVSVCLGYPIERIFRPFQCFNFLTEHPDFLYEVALAWNSHVSGNPWFVLTSKLKVVKAALKRLNRSSGNVHSNLVDARNALLSFQAGMDPNSHSDVFEEEKLLAQRFQSALKSEELFLKQKSRVAWLKDGDANNRFFFQACKGRWNKNKILSIQDDDGNVASNHKDMSSVAVNFFTNLMGSDSEVSPYPEDLDVPQLSDDQIEDLSRPFSDDDIWSCFKHMAKNKSPGPDGLTVEFFIASWNIIGSDVCRGIQFFFSSLVLPRIISSTALALIPKSSTPSSMSDYRPIACCNVIYKCIAKLLAFRLQSVVASLVSTSQSAFVPGRFIGDNILLAQALFKDYHLHSGSPRCAFKIDIKKAFDTLNWSFLRNTLKKMRFPEIFIEWVMSCISGCMLSVKVNGSLEGFFKARSGLRQGDPMSLYLFVLSMEVLSSVLRRQTAMPGFKFHWATKDLAISHLVFADDILMFCYGDSSSVESLLQGLNFFASCSGLIPNVHKSQCFFSSMNSDIVDHILSISGFQQGSLPIKYLGLPLLSTRLNYRDCMPLIVRIKARIDSWSNKSLNHAGRFQLIQVVLFGMLNFWTSHLFLPKAVIKSLQSLFVKFLWGGSSSNSKMAKVAWSACCFPKREGGLGFRDISTWNKAGFLFHLWRICFPSASSLWIAWFQSFFLARRRFWTMNIPSKASWCVKQIFHLRPVALRFMKFKIGSRSQFFFWHDPWLNNCPVLHQFEQSIISHAESTSDALVGDYITNSMWNLPPSNHMFVRDLRLRALSTSIHARDSISWGDISVGVTSSTIWNSLRVCRTPPLG